MQTRYVNIGILPFLLAVGACSSSQQQAPSALSSSSQLRTDNDIRGAYIYRAPNLDTSKYRRLLIEPIVVYRGQEANFGTYSEGEKLRFSQSIAEEFRKVLGEKIQLTNTPGPDVAKVRVTLLGVEGTVGGVATVTRLMPIGMAVNAVRGAAGAGGSLTGGIEIAVEVLDSQTNNLLVSAVRQEAPGAFDLEATLSTNDTVAAAAEKSAEALRDGIIRRAPQMARR